MLFDFGVFFVVFGTISAVLLALEARRRGGLMDAAFALLAGVFVAVAVYLLLSRSLSACCSASPSSATASTS